MACQCGFKLCAVVLCALCVQVARGGAQEALSENKLPEAVRKTFRAKFPKAKIEKLTAEEEEGVMVYDFEFRDGKAEKETDIAGDGTMLEWTLVVTPKDVPDSAMKPVRAAAEGATLGRTEQIKLSYTTKNGKVVKLPKPATHYAVEMHKGDQWAEIVVDPHGKVIEAPEWSDSKAEEKGQAERTAQ